MFRSIVIALALACLAAPVWAQTPPTAPTAKSGVKKPAPKARAAAKPATSAESGPCQIGVIPAIGDQFVLQKIGLTVFGNEETEVPVDGWGLDDLVVARVRAAAPGTAVRKIAYAKDAFDPWYHGHGKGLFNNPGENLTAVVRPIAANANCGRYVVVTRFEGRLPGTNQSLRGVGVLNRLFDQNFLFANVSVTVFDGQTFVIQKDPSDTVGARLAASWTGERDPVPTKASFPASATEAAGSAELRNATRALLATRLDKILPAYFKE